MSEKTNLQVTLNPNQTEFEVMQRQCRLAIMSGLLPDEYRRGDVSQQIAKAVVIAMKGRELGIPMIQAFSEIHIIKGKPGLSATLMQSLIKRGNPARDFNYPDYTNEKVTVCVSEPGKPDKKMTFSIHDAQQAEIAGGHSWKKYPRAMLRSRAISELARAFYADCLCGCLYTPEELGADIVDMEEPTTALAVVEEKPISKEEVKQEPVETTTPPVSTSAGSTEEDSVEKFPIDVLGGAKWKGKVIAHLDSKELGEAITFLASCKTLSNPRVLLKSKLEDAYSHRMELESA